MAKKKVYKGIEGYSTSTGERRYLARIRLKGFKPTSRGEFLSPEDAAEWRERTRREMTAARAGGTSSAEVGTITVRQLVERFLEDPQERLEHKDSYHSELVQMLGEWSNEYGSVRVRDLNRDMKVTFRNRLLATRSPARTNRYTSAMRRAWNWGIRNGYILETRAWPKEMMLKEPDAKEVIATPEEVAQVFAACDRSEPALGTLVRFLVGTGARLSDALGVRWRDVNDKSGDVAIRGQKTGQPLRVAMLTPAREAISAAKKLRKLGDERVFWQYEHRLDPRAAWLRARKEFPEHLRHMRMHDCRHLCASLLAANGATDVELAAQLGHSTLQMVKRYSHLRGGHRGAAHEKLDKAFGR
jgi:integrase